MAFAPRVVQQQPDLMIRVSTHDLPCMADVDGLHADQKVIVAIVFFRDLPRPLPFTGDAMLGQNCLCRRIHRISNTVPNFFIARGTGGDDA